MNELVSILIPAKNAEPFLAQCLDSILKQSIDSWEILAVNDHSDDATAKILRYYSEKDQRIQWFQNGGKGIIPALQQAFQNSRGNFITRMDADDHMPPQKLEQLLGACKSGSEKSLATGKVKYFSEAELGDGFIRYERWLNGLIDKGNPFREIYRECPIASPNWMMKRSFLESIGAFNSDVYPEDYDLIFRAYQNEADLQLVNSVTHFWRDHSDRTSRNDPNYLDNSFLELKVKYFLNIDFDSSRHLKIYGAGRRAKKIARLLLDRTVFFSWFTNNSKKIGKEIYGVTLQDHMEIFEGTEFSQIIVAVSSPDDQDEINAKLTGEGLTHANDFHFFC